jgi:hypothetical protein
LASAVWSDDWLNAWLNAGIQYSLAHFWKKTSFGQADIRYHLFPPIVLDDPRANMTAEERQVWGKDRECLVNGVIAKVRDSFHTDWGPFDALLIWFAQGTDLFGGGAYQVSLPYLAGGGGLLDFLFGEPEAPKKLLPVAVCDIDSSFDQVAQEVGHVFGFQHSQDRAGQDYGSPYDSMSSRRYGGRDTSFIRPNVPSLPIGRFVNGVNQQSVIGPLISAAQIYNNAFGQKVKDSGLFFQVPASYLTAPTAVKLIALDVAVDLWPGEVRPCLAVIPPSNSGGDTYFLKLRRGAGYDSGIAAGTDISHPPAGVVIHLFDRVRNRVVYVGVLPLQDGAGDRDYHVFAGWFTVRVTSIGAGFSSVGLLVGGGTDFWRNFGITFEDIRDDTL